MVIPAIELVEECASPVEFERATLRELDAAIGFDCAFFFTVDSAPTALGLPPEFASAVRESARALRYDREMEPVKAAALAKHVAARTSATSPSPSVDCIRCSRICACAARWSRA